MDLNRSERVAFRVRPAEKAALMQAAEKAGARWSEWARQALIRVAQAQLARADRETE